MNTATVTPPARTDEQRLRALDKANEIRSRRAKEKVKLAKRARPDALRLAMDYLASPPSFMATMRVEDFVRSCRGFGPEKTRKLLHRLKISPSRSVGALGATQRAVLLAALRADAERAEALRR